MRFSHILVGRVAALACLAILAGCGGSDEPSEGQAAGSSGSDGKVLTIGMSQCDLQHPWRALMDADIRAAAAEHPELKVVFQNAQSDSARQCAHIEGFVNSGVNLIIVSPQDRQPLTEPVAKAYQAGIPVIVLDQALIGDQYTCFIGANNEKIAHAAGEWLGKKLGGKGNIIELKGSMSDTAGIDRNRGFRDAIQDFPEIDMLYEVEMQWLEEEAREAMEEALTKYDTINGVFAHNDAGARGAYLAAKQAGREKDMVFVGIDALPEEGIAYVKEGVLDASFEYPTGGREAIETALKILGGKDVLKSIVPRSRCFTKENVEQGGEWIE